MELSGAQGVGDIAARIGVGQSGATRHIDQLQGKGLVVRTQHPEDRRKVQVKPTREGSHAVATFLPVINRLKRQLFTGIDEADIEVFFGRS